MGGSPAAEAETARGDVFSSGDVGGSSAGLLLGPGFSPQAWKGTGLGKGGSSDIPGRGREGRRVQEASGSSCQRMQGWPRFHLQLPASSSFSLSLPEPPKSPVRLAGRRERGAGPKTLGNGPGRRGIRSRVTQVTLPSGRAVKRPSGRGSMSPRAKKSSGQHESWPGLWCHFGGCEEKAWPLFWREVSLWSPEYPPHESILALGRSSLRRARG